MGQPTASKYFYALGVRVKLLHHHVEMQKERWSVKYVKVFEAIILTVRRKTNSKNVTNFTLRVASFEAKLLIENYAMFGT